MANISGIADGTGTTATKNLSATAKAMGKDDFMKLLIAQLKNQDPTNPQQGSEFASQLAQYSSLEQLTNLNSAITLQNQNNDKNNASLINAQLVNLIGKNITAATPAAADGTPGEPMIGEVTAVNFKSGAVTLTVNGKNIAFSDLLSVNE